MYSYGPPHIAEQKQDGQLEHTYSSSVRIQDVALETCQKRWTIGRSSERGLGISVLVARHDDDDFCITWAILSPLVGGWWGQSIERAFTFYMMKKNCFVMSYVTMSVAGSCFYFFCGTEFKKCTSSPMLLFILFWNDCIWKLFNWQSLLLSIISLLQ